MAEFIEIMLPPFVACIVLTGIHAYLGLHVLKREVIFVDLALSQLAAFGATVGFLFGVGLHSTESYFVSLLFTLCGAALFSATRLRKPKVPHEAIIGVVYAVGAAASILVLSRAPEGGEELRTLLVGHLLFVNWRELGVVTCVYVVVGVVHFLFRRQLFLISEDPEKAFSTGLRVGWWDFLFYATFGVVVTSSTELAGVLLVFSFLIVPAICATWLGSTIRSRLFIGWGFGAITSAVGVTLSYLLDLPTGATVVCAFGLFLLTAVALSQSLRHE